MNAADSLAEIQGRANAATDGPWAAWLDQDGADHMQGLLMVGNAAAVIPEGESWIEGVDVNPIAHTYCEEDRQFIAAARSDVPALVAALQAVLAQCDRHESIGAFTDYEVGRKYVAGCVRRAIENAIGATQ